MHRVKGSADGETVFVGIGISDLAGAIAKSVHTPNAILVAEAGYVGFPSVAVLVSPADNSAGAMAMCHQGLPEMLIDQQSGFIDAPIWDLPKWISLEM